MTDYEDIARPKNNFQVDSSRVAHDLARKKEMQELRHSLGGCLFKMKEIASRYVGPLTSGADAMRINFDMSGVLLGASVVRKPARKHRLCYGKERGIEKCLDVKAACTENLNRGNMIYPLHDWQLEGMRMVSPDLAGKMIEVRILEHLRPDENGETMLVTIAIEAGHANPYILTENRNSNLGSAILPIFCDNTGVIVFNCPSQVSDSMQAKCDKELDSVKVPHNEFKGRPRRLLWSGMDLTD